MEPDGRDPDELDVVHHLGPEPVHHLFLQDRGEEPSRLFEAQSRVIPYAHTSRT
jgi:hypothetical protein